MSNLKKDIVEKIKGVRWNYHTNEITNADEQADEIINLIESVVPEEKKIRIDRVWAMPSRWTFTIKPIAELLEDEVKGVSVDPFAGQSTLATHRNDLETDHPNKLDALEWLKTLKDNFADTVLYDPPYSITQAAKYNAKFASKAYWSACKKELARILKPGGTAISFGWNSGGLGKVNGLTIKRILLVGHGGNRNDTIVTVDIKSKLIGKE